MAKHIQLTIAEPCHENWEKMTTAEKGKFCGACQKQVIDFTRMSDAQVAAFFKRPSTASVCGRFMENQLDRDITIPKKRIPWVKYFFQLTLPLFLSSLRSNAQMGKIAVRRTNDSTAVCNRDVKGEIVIRTPVKEVQQVKGRVIDEEGKPLPYASVIIKGTHAGVAADSSGVFTLSLPQEEKVVLSISYIGFMPAEFQLPETVTRNKELLTIQLKKITLKEVMVQSGPVFMGMVVRKKVVRNSVAAGKTTIKKITPPLTIINTTPAMRVYPNPVSSGAAINIKCDKMEESYYSVQLLTLSGQMALQKEIWIDKDARILNMTIPGVAAGTYLLKMTSRKSGKSFTDKIVVE